ncbi:uncharacterized protein LOC143564900 [Bidens hawaiensis]|uniref:uncharacterized protein LOC143564900 n=1 Tax=Bidens hawaiensis TaxID=980011 RepID=UPI00404B9214
MMASRTILRRRRFISDYLHVSSRSIQGLNHGIATGTYSSSTPSNTNNAFNEPVNTKHIDAYFTRREDNTNLSAFGWFKMQKFHAITGNGSLGNMLHTRSNFGSRSSSFSSMASAPKPATGNDEEDKEQSAKKRKEASPEECDQAVEGLTSAKAKIKAKAKQVTDSQKPANSILKRTWAALLGIGPALRAVASMSREDWAKKLVHWKTEFVDTMKHYWLGIKLLGVDVKISSRLLLKLAGGKSLSRRERQQLTRTTADIFRLVPVAVFIIVPFMEFLLPVFLKLFPNMLPSTFQDKMKEQEALKRRLNARIEYAKFLQDTVKEMAKEVQNTRSGELKKTAEDLDEFLGKIRTGSAVANGEILGFAKLFNDELTLDNISRPRLVNMCKYMGIQPYGTDTYLRYMLRKRLQWYFSEGGVDALSDDELAEDCRERGMIGVLSVQEMRQQIHLYHSMMDKEGTDTVKAYKAAHEEPEDSTDEHVTDGVSSALINRVDAMLQKLEKEIDDVDAKIGDRWRVLDRDYDGKVTPEEVASAAIYLKDTLGKEGVLELVSNLSKDKEGKILVEDIVKLGSRADDAD